MNQTKKVDEVIINDDCSLDDTVKIVKDYIDAKELINWNVYINDRNLGFSSNFFTAIKKPQ